MSLFCNQAKWNTGSAQKLLGRKVLSLRDLARQILPA
jgi:hypothetical protein